MSQITPGIAIVTGGSSGIGRASAIALAQAGWTVVISGRREAELQETVRLGLSALGELKPIVPVVGDLSKPDDVRALFEFTKAKFGRVDLLFNNAGTGTQGAFDEVTLEDFEKLVAINITAPYLCAQLAFTIMKNQSPQGGRIINNGSVSAYTPRPNSAPYTMSKHAILGLTKSIALDGRPFNITCSQIDIGNAASAMGSRMEKGVPQADGSIRAEPVMPVEHVARSIVFMASFPLDANILNQTVMASAMPFVGRG